MEGGILFLYLTRFFSRRLTLAFGCIKKLSYSYQCVIKVLWPILSARLVKPVDRTSLRQLNALQRQIECAKPARRAPLAL